MLRPSYHHHNNCALSMYYGGCYLTDTNDVTTGIHSDGDFIQEQNMRLTELKVLLNKHTFLFRKGKKCFCTRRKE